jgi:hypothetical protein
METLNILAFGDSLTEGYSSWGTVFTPYGTDMKIWLDAALASTKVGLEVEGQSGDLVGEGGNFVERITNHCKCYFMLFKNPAAWISVMY